MHVDRERTIPSSTYRVQLSSAFTLDDLAAQVPYIARLGISHVYLSPIFTARPGSPHGYDVVDYGCINRELGGNAAWRRLADVLRAHRMGVVLDVVPNHMAADPENNPLWRQVLRDGPRSPAARFFDIDWRPLTGLVRDKVLLPILEEPYGQALTKGAVQVEPGPLEYQIRCGGLKLPLAPGSLDSFVIGQPIDDAVAQINRSPQLLHELLEQQHYRPAYWRPANDEINYRRFFGINELIATHAEDPEVFKRIHELVRKLVAEDVVDGVRVDHVDGLLDPIGYLRQLRSDLETAAAARPWLVVEKILEPSERLGTQWPVDGTTGYDALDALNRLFVSGRGIRVLKRFFQKLVDDSVSFREEAHRCKRLMMRGALLSGVTILAHELKRVADASWTTRDISLAALHETLLEFIAALPVYRTYLGTGNDRDVEKQIVVESLELAERRNPAMDASAFSFLRSLLLGELVDDPSLGARRALLVKRLQQYTSGVHAKGVEDTAFYRDNTLLASNEVGGSPAHPSLTIREFHHFNEQRARSWPNSMTATSTHDTKLSEDVRMRIAACSVFAHEWTEAVRRWLSMNTAHRRVSRRGTSPDVRDEYRFYQALVGMWSDSHVDGDGRLDAALVDRLSAFMMKSAREAQLFTSWMRPDADYEDGLDAFVRRVLTGDETAEFRRSVAAFVRLIEPVSTLHSISHLVLKCFVPGVPDFYQGSEDWLFTLTDPDNRRPVDFIRAAERLTDASQPAGNATSDVKLRITTTLLKFRADHSGLLREGSYRPLRVKGDRAASVVAFERRSASARVIVVVPRLTALGVKNMASLDVAFWGDTEIRLPSFDGRWKNLMAGEEQDLSGGWVRMTQVTAPGPWVVLHAARPTQARM